MQMKKKRKKTCKIYSSGPEKNARSLMHHNFATVCTKITRFSQNAQKLTGKSGNTTNGEILNIVIKYFCLAARKETI